MARADAIDTVKNTDRKDIITTAKDMDLRDVIMAKGVDQCMATDLITAGDTTEALAEREYSA